MKLARKLTLALVLSLGLVLALNAYVRVQREIGLFERDMRHDAHVMGRALGAAVLEVWKREGEVRALEVVAQANEGEGDMRIRWIFADAGPGEPHQPVAELAALEPLARGEDVVRKISLEGHNETLLSYIAVPAVAGRVGGLEFAESMLAENDYVDRTVMHALATTTAVAVVSALITSLLGILFLGRPMRRLIEQAKRVGAGDLSGRLSIDQRDEIGELAREMNAMCDQLATAHATVESETAARISALEQLRHADRLATVGKLASGIAHELGTPLQVVAGRARMIAGGDLPAEEVTLSAHIIFQQSQRITKIIRQLLDFARRRRAEKVRVDLAAMVTQTCTLLSSIADKKQLTLHCAPSDGEVDARVDPEQIQQALANLVVNGIDASRRDATLTIGAGRARIRPPLDIGGELASYVTLYVEDEGVGMSEETMHHVFEPFFTTKDVGDGTGLGLSVSYGIVRDHGGWIAVESEVGRGSRFTIYLPHDQEA